MVTLREAAVKLDNLGQVGGVVPVTQFMKHCSNVVGNQPKSSTKGTLLEHLHLPTRIVKMDTIKECTLQELVRNRFK